MDVGAFFNKFVGETEKNLRDAFRQAEMMAPVVLWIDEIEKAFSSARSDIADGGLSKRMFGALLTWMQEHRSPVFLIATANDISALPPELLRKGRFDEIFFVDLPVEAARRQIATIHLRRRQRDEKLFDLNQIVAASDGYSGAEIEQAIIAALVDAHAENQELATRHIVESLRRSPPLSVTMAERIAELRKWAEKRCQPAD
jgi:SpoVK/Ycf46/Vps4 family AAA+-type ATPase